MFKKLRRYLPGRLGDKTVYIPVVRLAGAIGIHTPLKQGLSLAAVAEPLEIAFKSKKAPAVAILINSPGGSPVQSHLIYQRIRHLAAEHEKQVLVFVEDVAASGGYMIALAGDDIFADPSSIVGSIGVVSAGFGFTELIKKAGVERRVYTAGEKKVTLDPFSPENNEDIEHLKNLQRDVHQTFIELVKSRRGDVLSDDPDLFTGLFWAGEKARDLGLVDDMGELRQVLKDRFGKDTETTLVGERKSFFGRIFGRSQLASNSLEQAAQALPSATLNAVEERSLWARFGL